MNNNDNELVRWAMEKIRCDEKHRPDCCVVVGPTAQFNNSSNNIIHKFKQITFKFKKIKYH